MLKREEKNILMIRKRDGGVEVEEEEEEDDDDDEEEDEGEKEKNVLEV